MNVGRKPSVARDYDDVSRALRSRRTRCERETRVDATRKSIRCATRRRRRRPARVVDERLRGNL
jgi:hypothetical protein